MTKSLGPPESRQDFDAELMGVLSAISIVSRRLAAQLSQLENIEKD